MKHWQIFKWLQIATTVYAVALLVACSDSGNQQSVKYDPPPGPDYFSASFVSEFQVLLNWSGSELASQKGILILRDTQPISAVPVDGVAYAEGDVIGQARVVFEGPVDVETDMDFVDGVEDDFFYAVFAFNPFLVYSSPVATGCSRNRDPLFRINNGESYTNSRSVTLSVAAIEVVSPPSSSLTAGSNVTHVRFANVEDELDTLEWEAYDREKVWTLSENCGVKSVYGQLLFEGGEIKQGSDSIVMLPSDVSSAALHLPAPSEITLVWDHPRDVASGGVLVFRSYESWIPYPEHGKRYTIGSFLGSAQAVYNSRELNPGYQDIVEINPWFVDRGFDVHRPIYYHIFSFSADNTYSRGIVLPYQPDPAGPPVGLFTINRDNPKANVRRVTIYPNVYNAVSMRFGNSETELATAAWHPYDKAFAWTLPLNFSRAEVLGEFMNDNGLAHRSAASIGFGEPAQWEKSITHSQTLRFSGIKPASDGGSFVYGETNPDGCLVIKFDSGGGIEWQRVFHHSDDNSPVFANYAVGVVETQDGGCLVFTLQGGVLRLDNGGNLLWANRIEGFHGYSAVGSAEGSFFVAGTDSNANSIMVGRLDQNGEIVWLRTFDLTGAQPCLSETEIDHLFVAGAGTVMKLTVEGEVVWSRSFDSGGDMMIMLVPEFIPAWEPHSYAVGVNSLVPDGRGGVFAVGDAMGYGWVGYIGDTGDPLWEKIHLSMYRASSLVRLENGEIILSGGSSPCIMVSLSDSGEHLWQRTLDHDTVLAGLAKSIWPEILLSGMRYRYEEGEQTWTGLYDIYIANALNNGYPFTVNESAENTRVLRTHSNPSDNVIANEPIIYGPIEVSVSMPDLVVRSLY
jgi:hypothetical protein